MSKTKSYKMGYSGSMSNNGTTAVTKVVNAPAKPAVPKMVTGNVKPVKTAPINTSASLKPYNKKGGIMYNGSGNG